jgi:hypothetical protein
MNSSPPHPTLNTPTTEAISPASPAVYTLTNEPRYKRDEVVWVEVVLELSKNFKKFFLAPNQNVNNPLASVNPSFLSEDIVYWPAVIREVHRLPSSNRRIWTTPMLIKYESNKCTISSPVVNIFDTGTPTAPTSTSQNSYYFRPTYTLHLILLPDAPMILPEINLIPFHAYDFRKERVPNIPPVEAFAEYQRLFGFAADNSLAAGYFMAVKRGYSCIDHLVTYIEVKDTSPPTSATADLPAAAAQQNGILALGPEMLNALDYVRVSLDDHVLSTNPSIPPSLIEQSKMACQSSSILVRLDSIEIVKSSANRSLLFIQGKLARQKPKQLDKALKKKTGDPVFPELLFDQKKQEVPIRVEVAFVLGRYYPEFWEISSDIIHRDYNLVFSSNDVFARIF